MTKRTVVDRKSDQLTNRILIVFASTLLAIIGLMTVYKSYNRAATMFHTRTALLVLACVGAAGIAAGIYIALRAKHSDKYKNQYSFGVNLSGFMAVFAGSCLFMGVYHNDAVRVLYFALPVCAVLYLIYQIYQREFFAISLLTSLGGFVCWAISRLANQPNLSRSAELCAVGCLLTVAVAALFFFLIKRGGGALRLGAKRIALMPGRASYRFIFITCALIAASVVLAMLLGPLAAYYAVFILFAYLFIMAVYYTVKLM